MRCSDARGPVTLSSATCLAQARAKAACQAASVDSVAYDEGGASADPALRPALSQHAKRVKSWCAKESPMSTSVRRSGWCSSVRRACSSNHGGREQAGGGGSSPGSRGVELAPLLVLAQTTC